MSFLYLVIIFYEGNVSHEKCEIWSSKTSDYTQCFDLLSYFLEFYQQCSPYKSCNFNTCKFVINCFAKYCLCICNMCLCECMCVHARVCVYSQAIKGFPLGISHCNTHCAFVCTTTIYHIFIIYHTMNKGCLYKGMWYSESLLLMEWFLSQSCLIVLIQLVWSLVLG